MGGWGSRGPIAEAGQGPRVGTPLPAFDGLALETGENQLFGDAQTDKRHFTAFAARRSRAAGGTRADALTVRQMNAMHYARDASTRAAPHWRIRQGTGDYDLDELFDWIEQRTTR